MAIERAAHRAFALAARRSGRLCLVTKSDVMSAVLHTMESHIET